MATDDKKTTKKPAKTKIGFSADERSAMRQHVLELKAEAAKADGEQTLLAAIAAMPEPDRSKGERLHAIISASAPTLEPKTWYGMPAYAKDDKIVCFFQPASKFKMRYMTLGFDRGAQLDDGAMWPVAFAVMEVTPEVEARIRALVKKAAG